MRVLTIFILLNLFLFQAGCSALKYKKVSAKEFPPDPEKRIEKNINEGRGFRIMNTKSGNTNYEFASANPLWRATLDTLDFMPLVSANYSGGIVVTDWYSENNATNESIKISVKFLSNEIRSDALDIDVFLKKCSKSLSDCSVSKQDSILVTELNANILKKAAKYEKESADQNKP
jgi:hypothetical protein